MKTNILFETSAINIVLKYLKEHEGYTWENVITTNKNRYAIVHGNPNIAILLKTEPFYKFGVMFPQHKGAVGDSINVNQLREFKQHFVEYIYVMFRDSKIYKIHIDTFLKESERWTQKEGTEVRSVNIKLYERVNKDASK